jgi:uncharacterized protein DUF3857/transglutaminase superfamily protein
LTTCFAGNIVSGSAPQTESHPQLEGRSTVPHRLAILCRALILVFIGYSLPLTADSFRPVLDEELKMTSEPLAPGAPAVILYRQVDRDDSGVDTYEDDYFRIKILTEQGRKYANIEIPYFKGDAASVRGIKARTIRPDGSIVDFEGQVYEKPIVKAKGVRYMAKTFTLPEVQVGSIIEYYYTVNLPSHYIFDSHWILSEELFTKTANFSLKPNSRFTCRWRWLRPPQGGEELKEGADHVFRLKARNIPAFHAEDFMPPADELKSRVDFTYSLGPAEKSPADFWKRKGKELNGKVESFAGKRKTMEEAVAQIVSPGDTPETKLQKIYARVQQIRNTSYEVRKTEQEKKHENEKDAGNVEDVWRRGYGTGAQLTWLFLALARSAGLEAYPIVLSERRHYFFIPEFMDAEKLDANVVLVKLNGKEIYCDPGGAFTPFGLLQWPETGVSALRLDKDGGTWITTALPKSSVSRIEHKANLILNETGDLEGQLAIIFTGLEAMRLRVDQRHADEADRKKFLEDLAREHIPAAAEVELNNKPDWSSSSQDFVAQYTLKVPGWIMGAGRRALFPVGVFSAAEKRVFDSATRTHPIYFEFPFARQDDISITLPVGWQVSSLPPAQDRSGPTVSYAIKAENDHGTLHLTRKLTIDLLLVEAKYYDVLRNFFQMVRSGDEEQVLLQPIGVSAGR